MKPYLIRAPDRESYKRCRRAWDFGSRSRQGYEPLKAVHLPKVEETLVDALAVYYFPGMWSWARDIVLPIAHQAIDRSWQQRGGARSSSGSIASASGLHALLDHYARWASTVDQFTPVRAALDYAVNIPDPIISERELVTLDGSAVRYAGRIDILVLDDEDRPWVVVHRIGSSGFTDPELLQLDEATTTCCWAWQQGPFGPPVAGVIFNEIQLEPEAFRRTEVPRSAVEVELAGRQLGFEALEMIDAGLRAYPNPTVANCGPCPFRAPCLAMQRGEDPGPVLAASYRRRPDDELEEGRLGGMTWGMGRGARPPTFGGTR
jgi:hypothetical protein